MLSPIGIFDSGYGGLTIFKAIKHLLPQYDYIYFGDNARAPYGGRSFDTVYEYTLQCTQWLIHEQHCPLVILACNTASARALRNIQQLYLPTLHNDTRVLGVIRPSAEELGKYTKTKHIGILGTQGTVRSQSYILEMNHFYPDVNVYQQACPLWVPIIEGNDYEDEVAHLIIKKDIDALFRMSPEIDTVLLACTHYPLLMDKIKCYVPPHVTIVTQGELVAQKLENYLTRHPEKEKELSKHQQRTFFTTEDPKDFANLASQFFDRSIEAHHVKLSWLT